MTKSDKFDLVKRRADFDHEIARRSVIGLTGRYKKEPKELADDLKVFKVELEKQIPCVETNETKMMERAHQEAHQQNLWDHIFRMAATTLAREVTMAEALVTISTSAPTTLSPMAVMTAIDDGDDDLIITSKPKSGDGLNVFVADLRNAGSYVNVVRKNQKRETERRKDLACCNGTVSIEGLDNNNDGQ